MQTISILETGDCSGKESDGGAEATGLKFDVGGAGPFGIKSTTATTRCY